MKQYKEWDRVVLDFNRCTPDDECTPGGLWFPSWWRERLHGATVTIHDLYTKQGLQRYHIKEIFPQLYSNFIAIDEYCIRGSATENFFDTSGLEDLI